MVMTSLAERNYAFHRAELQRVFMQKLRPRQVQLRKRLESYTQRELYRESDTRQTNPGSHRMGGVGARSSGDSCTL